MQVLFQLAADLAGFEKFSGFRDAVLCLFSSKDCARWVWSGGPMISLYDDGLVGFMWISTCLIPCEPDSRMYHVTTWCQRLACLRHAVRQSWHQLPCILSSWRHPWLPRQTLGLPLTDSIESLKFHEISDLLYRDNIFQKHCHRDDFAGSLDMKKQLEDKSKNKALRDAKGAMPLNHFLEIVIEHLLAASCLIISAGNSFWLIWKSFSFGVWGGDSYQMDSGHQKKTVRYQRAIAVCFFLWVVRWHPIVMLWTLEA